MKKIKLLAIALTILAGVIAGPGIASADDGNGAFLCPIVGDGVLVGDAHSAHSSPGQGGRRSGFQSPMVGSPSLQGNTLSRMALPPGGRGERRARGRYGQFDSPSAHLGTAPELRTE